MADTAATYQRDGLARGDVAAADSNKPFDGITAGVKALREAIKNGADPNEIVKLFDLHPHEYQGMLLELHSCTQCGNAQLAEIDRAFQEWRVLKAEKKIIYGVPDLDKGSHDEALWVYGSAKDKNILFGKGRMAGALDRSGVAIQYDISEISRLTAGATKHGGASVGFEHDLNRNATLYGSAGSGGAEVGVRYEKGSVEGSVRGGINKDGQAFAALQVAAGKYQGFTLALEAAFVKGRGGQADNASVGVTFRAPL